MFTVSFKKWILVAGGISTLTLGAPIHEDIENRSFIHERATDGLYTLYSGNGETNVGWPTEDQWVSDFNTMFEDSMDILKTGCSQYGLANNSDDEISDLKSAVQEVSSTTGIDPRFIFAVLTQESSGCVRVQTTVYSIANPGLMQSHEGTGSCNRDGVIQNPCPMGEMVQMITDGVAGTATGDGLKQCIAESGATDVSKYYKAARIYNSGSVAPGGNLGQGIATHCYATDIANRLTGWYEIHSPCDPNTVGSLDGSPVSPDGGSGGSGPVSSNTASPISSPTASPIASLTSSSTASSTPTTSPSTSTPTSPTNKISYTPGISCSSPGKWNCIDGNTYQQCSSGIWSVIRGLAAGTECTMGQGDTFDVHALPLAYKRRRQGYSNVETRGLVLGSGLKSSQAHGLTRDHSES
ncbi:hypothetical protein DSL72_003838 [Monilinia vaccinii-corymbosi]|uniref:Transglycosylase SLT domain-containing protein n=1 Tax=Monilinia vaccinii-corymbosi TaxID=61207 RepID=A0A8A3P0P4_9HELO|nr:hypothetical protein DSL72_003838 [Monilinia vaccinii-corymbosi]